MIRSILQGLLFFLPVLLQAAPLFYWQPSNGTENFGDHLSKILIERILGREVQQASIDERKVLAVGSILHFAREGDVIWGSGLNGKHVDFADYSFQSLDIRSVRGPLTYQFLKALGLNVPQVYGDPVLLFPQFFPEFKVNPVRKYVVIIHSSEESRVPKDDSIIYSTDPWEEIVTKITESQFVISTSLHGLIIAEAFNIPARLLRISRNEPIFKFADYYLGTKRPDFQYATTLHEAFLMGGESPPIFDADQILKAFPWDQL